MNPLWTLEAANLFCGTVPADVTPSNHLVLAELKLPAFDEQYVDHRPGGAPVAIEIDTIFARPECTFTLAGWTTQVASLIASWVNEQNLFFAYCALRDRLTGDVIQAIAEMRGRLGRADPQNWRRGDLQHWAYSIRGMNYYKLSLVPGGVLYEWDFFTNTLFVDGVDRNSKVNDALHLTVVGPPAPPTPTLP